MKTIVLADTRWSGHHPTFFREFAASLLRQGARVIALCPDPEELLESLPPDNRETDDRLFAAKLTDRGKSFLLPGRDHDPLSTILRWRRMARAVRAAEKATGWRSDLVFFPYLDSWLRFCPFPWLPQLILRRPWSGLYFRCAHLGERNGRLSRLAKGDAILRSRDCIAVATLDEQFAEQLATVSGRKICHWPDITDEESPDPPGALAEEIAQKAGGRPIIGMVSLSKRKGLLTLLRIAEAARGKRDWFFACAGPFHDDLLTAEELAFVQRCATNGSENLHLDLQAGRVSDGRDFNSLVNHFDVVYAAYEDFQGSSNALTKAALFRKPVIATKGGTVGNRVEQFGLGRVIPEGDAIAGEAAIADTLASDIEDWRFEAYHEHHNRDRLDALFGELMEIATPDATSSRGTKCETAVAAK